MQFRHITGHRWWKCRWHSPVSLSVTFQSLSPVCVCAGRAEEEDEHLERTLEQNKGKMAKKEEKCVLQ